MDKTYDAEQLLQHGIDCVMFGYKARTEDKSVEKAIAEYLGMMLKKP